MNAASPVAKCEICGGEFNPHKSTSRFCSKDCRGIHDRRAERPSREELHRMVWSYPVTEIAQKLGVSDVAVGKWCKTYGIDKPPRGYWAKQYSMENRYPPIPCPVPTDLSGYFPSPQKRVFTNEQIIHIRTCQTSTRRLAKEHGCCIKTIFDIRHYNTYKEVK